MTKDDEKTYVSDVVFDAWLEGLAEDAHSVWSHWMKYLFSRCKPIQREGRGIGWTSGDVAIPYALAERWTRQMNTPYVRLSEKEKQSDRDVILEHHKTTGIILILLRSAGRVATDREQRHEAGERENRRLRKLCEDLADKATGGAIDLLGLAQADVVADLAVADEESREELETSKRLELEARDMLVDLASKVHLYEHRPDLLLAAVDGVEGYLERTKRQATVEKSCGTCALAAVECPHWTDCVPLSKYKYWEKKEGA